MGKAITEKSQRVVVDEIFDNGSTRILRSSHLEGSAVDDYSIKAWGDETESFIDTWRMEAFAGFPSDRRLREGDVFFVVDGTRLNDFYKPIPREKAREEHLLLPYEDAVRFARREIKKQFYRLSVTRMTKQANERHQLMKRVAQKFEKDLPEPDQGSDA